MIQVPAMFIFRLVRTVIWRVLHRMNHSFDLPKRNLVPNEVLTSGIDSLEAHATGGFLKAFQGSSRQVLRKANRLRSLRSSHLLSIWRWNFHSAATQRCSFWKSFQLIVLNWNSSRSCSHCIHSNDVCKKKITPKLQLRAHFPDFAMPFDCSNHQLLVNENSSE